jgi:branched-chain amino acid transport system substrate-binding protein
MLSQRKLLAVAAAVVTLAAGCSSTSKPAAGTRTGTGTGSTNHTVTVGILTDLTGPAASGNKTSVMGVAAGAVEAAKEGYTIKYIPADTATSPATTLSAVQKLVEQDHVSAVLAVSALTFAAADYLKAQGVPVIGAAEDGPEWIPDTNMFSVYGFLDGTKVSTTAGLFFKSLGVTTLGSLGYAVSPGSSEASKASAASAHAAGIKVGYLNAQFPFGSTNVTPVALAMKNAHVDGFTSSTDPNTSFALITALRQAGDNPKVALLPDGYGGDLVQAGPGAIQSGQGVFFSLSFQPAEMHTAATIEFQNALKAVGVTGDPTYGEYGGYASVALLVDALKTAGTSASHSALISALTAVKGYDAWGLLGTHTFDMDNRAATATGVDSCLYVTKLVGSSFQLVPGADPLCGSPIPGLTVSASS